MLSLLALVAVLPSVALADDTPHPQVNASVQGTHVVNETWEIRGSGHAFWAPSPADDTELFFLYAGPKLHLSHWFSIAPQVGSVVNWAGTGDIRPLLSVWNWVDLNHLHFFVEADIYPDFAGSMVDYYGLYTADYDRLGIVWLGAQMEQVDASVNVGPHIGVPLGDHVFTQVNYHRNLMDGSNAIRFNINVSL